MDSAEKKCRICLEESQSDRMYELFEDRGMISNEENNQRMSLNEKVETCCRVKIKESADMPSRICQKCFDMVYYWERFQSLCWNSQVYLESICYDNEFLDKDINHIFNSLILTSLPHINKMKPYDDDDDSEENFDFIETEFISQDEKICLPIEEPNEQDLKEIESGAIQNNDDKKGKIKKKSHQRSPSPSQFMCNKCGNVYTKKSTFIYHMSTHDNIRPHECEACGKRFRQVCELKNHIRRHTGEKPFKCSYCDRSFIDRSEKHRHERTHTNDRPYKCNICGKCFAYSAILKNHKKMHTGQKAFNCLVCDKAFTLQHQLKAHLNTLVHKQKATQFISAGYEVVYE